jgi:hypothetical protein
MVLTHPRKDRPGGKNTPPPGGYIRVNGYLTDHRFSFLPEKKPYRSAARCSFHVYISPVFYSNISVQYMLSSSHTWKIMILSSLVKILNTRSSDLLIFKPPSGPS